MGYATGQFGKNHLGDLNEFLPTVHGFDEFFGYLYHLDAMEDPAHPAYPQELLDKVGPRNMVHSWATDTDDPTVMPRWGKIGKQKIEDAGTLYPKRMETVDDEIRDLAFKFIDKAKADGKPFFLWLNPTRMHIVTHLSDEVRGDAQLEEWLDHSRSRHGPARRHRRRGDAEAQGHGRGRQHHRRVHHRQRHRDLHLARWRQHAVRGAKGHGHEGGFRAPAMIRWPGKVPAGTVENGIISGLDWFPTFVAAAGNPNITEELLKGKKIGDRTYKNHLDGYNQMDMITGKGPSARHEIFYFGESTLGAVRIDDFKYRFIDQPGGWLGDKTHVDVPSDQPAPRSVRAHWAGRKMGRKTASQKYFGWFQYEFWRFVFVQQEVAKLAMTAIEYPPMQKGASFNLEAVKAKIEEAMKQHAGPVVEVSTRRAARKGRPPGGRDNAGIYPAEA